MAEGWVGKKVCIIFNDGSKINRKIGVVEGIDHFFVTIRLDNNSLEAIPISRIIRVELWEK